MGVTLVTYVTFVSNIIVMCHWSPNVPQETSYNCRVSQTCQSVTWCHNVSHLFHFLVSIFRYFFSLFSLFWFSVTLCHSVTLVMCVTLVTYVTFVSNIIVMCHWSPNVPQETSYNCRVSQTCQSVTWCHNVSHLFHFLVSIFRYFFHFFHFFGLVSHCVTVWHWLWVSHL
jgi:hypothetical protein